MKEELLKLLQNSLDENLPLSPLADQLISDYAFYHLWWAVGWSIPTLMLGFLVFAGIHGMSDDTRDKDALASATWSIFIIALVFFFNVVYNFAVFLSPLGDLL